MGGGLAFLSKKRFNPANFSNQKRVWEAQQLKLEAEKRLKEREELLKKERGETELAIIMGGKDGGAKQSLRFMYAPPPGVTGEGGRSDSHVVNKGDGHFSDNNSGETRDFFSPGEGDDPATAQFRLMFAGAASALSSSVHHENRDHHEEIPCTSTKAEPLTEVAATVKAPVVIDNRTKLEKEVGKLASSRAMPTLSEQMERFPQLKNAPIAVKRTASTVADASGNAVSIDNVMSVQFKPMGATLRNVRCFKCGIWGHSVGDRECKLTGWNPFDDSLPDATKNTSCQDSCNKQPLAASARQDNMEKEPEKISASKGDIQKHGSHTKRKYDSEDSQSVTSSRDLATEHQRRSKRKRQQKRRAKGKDGDAADIHSSDSSSCSRYERRGKKERSSRKRSKTDKKKDRKLRR